MNSQTIAIIVFTASIANYYYFVNNAIAQTGSTPGTVPGSTPGSTIIELSPLIQSIRMHVNETVVALQDKNIQGAITHLKLIDNQLADLSMISARGIINGTKAPVH
jgi:hypothetical protein